MAYKTTTDQKIGVNGSYVARVLHTIELTILSIPGGSEIAFDDEIILTLNGRVIKRMNRYQAERLGLLQERGM